MTASAAFLPPHWMRASLGGSASQKNSMENTWQALTLSCVTLSHHLDSTQNCCNCSHYCQSVQTATGIIFYFSVQKVRRVKKMSESSDWRLLLLESPLGGIPVGSLLLLLCLLSITVMPSLIQNVQASNTLTAFWMWLSGQTFQFLLSDSCRWQQPLANVVFIIWHGIKGIFSIALHTVFVLASLAHDCFVFSIPLCSYKDFCRRPVRPLAYCLCVICVHYLLCAIEFAIAIEYYNNSNNSNNATNLYY